MVREFWHNSHWKEDEGEAAPGVAQGFLQVQGIRYNKVFAPTARMAAIRMDIAIAAIEDLELGSVDISTAFLNGDIDAEIYMKISECFEVDGEPHSG